MPNLPLTSKKPLLLALLSAGVFAASMAHADSDSLPKSTESTQENAAATDAYSNDAMAGTSNAGMSMTAQPSADSSGSSGSTSSSDTSLSSENSSAAKAADSSGVSTKGQDSKLSDSDQDLMQEITQANLAEIGNAQLALDKSDDAEVKRFAQQMLDDHTAAQADLTKLAQDKGGIELPTQPNARQKMEHDDLSAMSGKDFDKAYMKRAGVKDHTKVHALLEQAEKKAEDKDLQAYISDTKETVADHLRMAKDMNNDAGVRSGDSGSTGSMDTGAGSSGDKADDAAGASGDKR